MKFNKTLLILSIVLLLSLSFVSASLPLESDLIAWYKMDDVSCPLTEEVNSYDATCYGTPTTGVGAIYNLGVDFEVDSNEYAKSSSIFDISALSQITICFWGKSESLAEYGMGVNLDNTGLNNGIMVRHRPDGYLQTFIVSSVGNSDYISSDSTYAVDTDYFVCGGFDGTDATLWVNGDFTGTNTNSGTGGSLSSLNDDILTIASDRDGSTQTGDGIIGEVYIFDTTLTDDEMDSLYNSGSGVSVPFTSSVVQNFSITAVNFWDDSSITSFWADIDGTNYSTTNGTINTALYQNDTSTYTLEVGAVDYFFETYLSVAVSSNFEAVLHQSEISFDTYDLVTGLSLENYSTNLTIDSQLNTTFYLSEANDYVVLVETEGDYRPLNYTFNVTALQIETLNITGLYNASINFNISDIVTGSLIDVNTTIYLNYTGSSWSDSFNAVNGSVEEINLSQLNYTALIVSDGYAPKTVNISVNNSTQTFSYSLYSNNSVWITAVDFDSAIELTNFSVTVSNVNNTYSGSDGDTGIVRINDVEGGVYTVRVTKSGYAVGEYALLMTGGSHQNVIAYLSSAGSTTIFTIVDSISGQIIEGATGNMYKSINSSYTLVSSQVSDITGRIQYSYTPDIEYKFVMDADDYDQRSFFLKPLFSSYTIRLTPGVVSVPDLNTGDYVYEINNSGLFYDDLNNSFEISISSGMGTIEYYNLTVTDPDAIASSVNCAVAQGCSDSFNIEIVDATFEDSIIVEYWIKESGRSEKYFKKVYQVQNIYDPSTLEGWKDVDDEDVDSLSKAFIAMIVCLIVVGFVSFGSIMVGVPPVTPSGFVLALLVEVFAYVDFIPDLAGHLVALGCILIVIFGRGEL